jgi:hypothetical protein
MSSSGGKLFATLQPMASAPSSPYLSLFIMPCIANELHHSASVQLHFEYELECRFEAVMLHIAELQSLKEGTCDGMP